MVELGLIQEEKPKQVGVKRKKQPAPAPSRRSSRVKELLKDNCDVDDDWEVGHFGKRRKLTEKKALSDKVEVVESRKSPRNLPVINYGQLDADMDDQILGPKTSIPAVKTGTKQAAPEKKLSCPYVDCESSFAYPSHLERHRQSVHLKQRPFKCVTCGLRFTQEFNFTQHVDVVHHKRRPFSCTAEGCGYTCGRASHLKQHTLSQHSAAPPRFPCTHPGCSEHLKSKLGLRIHVMNHLLPFTCQVKHLLLQFSYFRLEVYVC